MLAVLAVLAALAALAVLVALPVLLLRVRRASPLLWLPPVLRGLRAFPVLTVRLGPMERQAAVALSQPLSARRVPDHLTLDIR